MSSKEVLNKMKENRITFDIIIKGNGNLIENVVKKN